MMINTGKVDGTCLAAILLLLSTMATYRDTRCAGQAPSPGILHPSGVDAPRLYLDAITSFLFAAGPTLADQGSFCHGLGPRIGLPYRDVAQIDHRGPVFTDGEPVILPVDVASLEIESKSRQALT
jgi:hypothetical protein